MMDTERRLWAYVRQTNRPRRYTAPDGSWFHLSYWNARMVCTPRQLRRVKKKHRVAMYRPSDVPF